jgi:4-amino-4-deoxy-L-arabinose transferase-like glycosyltransferase
MKRFSRTAQALSQQWHHLRQDLWVRDGAILLGLWGITALLDLIWFQLDQGPPAWDQGDHLNRALEHWRLLQGFQPFDASWWRALWELSPGYRAPLVYLVTAPFFWLFGPGYDQAMAVNTLFTGVLIFATYGLGRTLFDRATGLWTALLCPWLPMLVATRLDYLLDYGLTASVLLFFYSLTQWRQPTSQPQSWGWTVGAGIACGLAVLAKFTSAFFLLMPLIWCGVESLMCKRWLRLVQLLCLVGIAILVFGPWFQVNWLTVLTSGTTSNTTWIPAGVNPDNPLSVWSYYLRVLPRMISWPLLWAAMGGLIIALVNIYQGRGQVQALKLGAWIWLWVFMGGAYGLLSLLQNKDPRHIMPYLPVVLLALVRATLVGQRRSRYLRPITAVGLSGLMVLGMFPVIPLPAWAMQRPPDRTAQWPHTEVVSTILAQAPYMKSVLGVIPNTAQLNPMNFDFYGKLADFQVFGREVSLNEAAVDWDAHALDWFVAKSGEQGPDNGTGQAKPRLQEQVANSPDYAIAQTWPLPDESTLFLYHRRQPMLTVATLPDTPETAAPSPLSLSVTVPQSSLAAGETWPVQYDIFGDLAQLETGVLILTWEPLDQAGQPTAGQGWTQDHGVGFGLLNLPSTKLENRALEVRVSERIGLPIPPQTAPGVYSLTAEFLDRETGVVQPLALNSPEVTVTAASADGTAAAIPAFRPDLTSTLRELSLGLAEGELEAIFATVGRINQYDPYQDYLKQTEAAMAFRLINDPENLNWLYPLALAQVLQQNAPAAAETLGRITEITPENPHLWAYLAFVNLYQWRPSPAQKALVRLQAIAPDFPELPYLQAVAALQRGNLWQVWRSLKAAGVL